jgi:hypothetical protein
LYWLRYGRLLLIREWLRFLIGVWVLFIHIRNKS